MQRTDIAVAECNADTPYRWAWSQTLENKGSTSVTFTQRLNFFNGTQVTSPTFTFTLSPGEKHTHPTRWCTAATGSHTFRTDWVMSSGQRITGPTVELKE